MSKTKARILVVDDDEKNLLTLEAVLADLGQEVVCVRSGRDALRLLLQKSVALILLDINMPGMDGFETANLIRQRQTTEKTPIIFITAHGEEFFMRRSYSIGAVDYILTPIVPDVLRSKVSVFVELFQQTEQIRKQSQRLQQRTRQLSALANQLNEAEHRERRRLAQVLHDHLQQLLVAAKMRISSVARATGPEVMKERLDALDDLLDESISISRSLTVELSPPILHDSGLIHAMQWLARKLEKDHGLKAHVDTDGVEVRIPENMLVFLYQAIRELLFNVVKHAGVNEAWMSIEHSDDRVKVTVRDNGSGFKVQQIADQSNTEHFGLFSIQERLVSMNGSLVVQSEEEQGTTVTITVPVAMETSDKPPVCTSSIVTGKGQTDDGRKRVLLVDDHQLLRKGLASLLESHHDIEVVAEAGNGEDAVRIACEIQPDVVVMDVSMPGIGGVEATRRIVAKLQHTQVIGLSMHESAEVEASLLKAGAVRFLNKDGPPAQLLEAIRHCPTTRNAHPPKSQETVSLKEVSKDAG